ncbi:MAG: rhomboid family intramembrane serine protease [Thermoguttaceae bacterium]|jgi:membrane associated rhomboid family serine protease|nr:rhomboid family intramembrane serine protease [Thermoguttaceae bacterium]
MGIHDRDYYRRDRSGLSLGGPRTMVGTLILINVVFYLADALFTPDDHRVTKILEADSTLLGEPWYWWKLVTYGFAHAAHPQHIFLNMLGLFFLGFDVEATYGRKEFLRIYLAALLVGSLAWAITNRLTGDEPARLLGASGAVTAVVVLYALNFPRRELLFFFVFPMPAWLVGVLVVAIDLWSAIHRPESNVAYTVHLAGAAFALLYFQTGMNFGRLVPSRSWFRRRPKLRIHRPETDDENRQTPEMSDDLAAEVDRILAKISREGEASLTRKERRTLQNASRQYQKRRRGDGP